MRLNQVTMPCTNVAESVEFYTKLGLIQIVASDHYARFVCPDGDATLSVHVVDEVADGAAPVVYFECDDLDLTVAELEVGGHRLRLAAARSAMVVARSTTARPGRQRGMSLSRGREPAQPAVAYPVA